MSFANLYARNLRQLLSRVFSSINNSSFGSRRRRVKRNCGTETLESRQLLTQHFGFSADYRTLVSGASGSAGTAVATDPAGNVFVTGDFSGNAVDFDPTLSSQSPGTSAGGTDIYVSKFDPAGNQLWNVRIGGTGDDAGLSISALSNDSVVIAGFYSGTVDFDPGSGAQNSTSLGGKDAFVLELNSATGGFIALNAFGSTGEDQATGVATAQSVQIAVTGFFNGTVDFDKSTAVHTAVSAGGDDIFLLHMGDNMGFSNVFRMGGTGSDRGQAVAMDKNQDFLLTGSFSGTGNFNPRAAAVNLVSAGLTDAFTARYDSAMFLKWAAGAGGTQADTGTDVEFAPDGSAVASGIFAGTADFDPSAGVSQLTSRGSKDSYVMQLDNFGALAFVQQIGGSKDDVAGGITVDSVGSIFITGSFGDTVRFGKGNGAFPQTIGAFGVTNVYLAKLTRTGEFLYSQSFTSNQLNTAGGVTLGPDQSLYMSGTYKGSLDVNPGNASRFIASATLGMFLVQLKSDLGLSLQVNDEVVIRRNGDRLEIVAIPTGGSGPGTLIESALISETRSVEIDRSTAVSSKSVVDFRTGGAFSLPGGLGFLANPGGAGDRLEVLGVGTEALTVRPSTTAAGAGEILAHNQTIRFSSLESVSLSRSLSAFVETTNATDVLTLDAAVGPGNAPGTLIAGTSGGVQMIPVTVSDIPSLTIDTGISDVGAVPAQQADAITINSGGLDASGLKNVFLRTGKGNDVLTINGPDLSLPISGGAFWYIGGAGVDRIAAVADTNYDLNDTRLVSSGGGRIQIDEIEKASLTGGASANHLNASAFTGDSVLDGVAGADLLRGGFGNDSLFGGTGNDRLYGNEGDDQLFGQDNNDQLFGGNGEDNLDGAAGNDRLFGDDGDDTLFGQSGTDEIYGGNGNDRVSGGIGNDLLFGGAGNDLLEGGDNDDLMDGGSGSDTFIGGSGLDLVILEGTTSAEDLQLQRLSATSALFKRKPRGLQSVLEQDTITMDATDEFFINALAGDDLISVDAALTQLGSVDGGDGTDSCTSPAAWTRVSC